MSTKDFSPSTFTGPTHIPYASVPRLVWGDRDWAKLSEREHDRKLIPGAEMTTISGGGHFLPLDRPQDVVGAISRFAGAPVPASAR